jgi:transcriptional regulator with GAF, ATPase, and Fis domain
VLVTLDIALYRFENNLEAKLLKEGQLQEDVAAIMGNADNWQEKHTSILKAFQSHIPFDYHSICWENQGTEFDDGHIFFKEEADFQLLTIKDLSQKTGKTSRELKQGIVAPDALNKAKFFVGEEFEKMCSQQAFRKIISRTFGLKSALIIPVFIPGKGVLTYSFYSHVNNAYSQGDSILIDRMGMLLIRVAQNIPRTEEEFQSPVAVLPDQQFPSINVAPLSADDDATNGLIGSGPTFSAIKEQIGLAAPFEISVLILGESGTGKEKIAQAIHRLSNRKNQPLIKVNCAAIPATLMESELFGHEKGAFTGALTRRLGKFEQANGGSIFLDEIGELPLDLQVKLLCVLQEKEIVRLGGNQTIKINVRIIAATNRNLEKEVAEGRFRLDLYYRLNVFPVILPPLRERREDIRQLAYHFLNKLAKPMGKNITGIADDVLQQLMRYDWPGNIRELENLIERAILMTSGQELNELEIPKNKMTVTDRHTPNGQVKTIKELEKDHILAVLQKCNGRIGGPGGAAELLDVAPSTLISKIDKLGIVKKFTIK